MRYRNIAILVATAFILSGCAYFAPVTTSNPEPGIFYGILHGFFAIPTAILSFFFDIQMYQTPNSGNWYDIGFVIGFSLCGGGLARGKR